MSALFDTKKFHLLREKEEKRRRKKRADRLKFPMPTKFVCSLLRNSSGDVEWAMNWFFEKENTGDRGREWGFSQAAMTPVLLPNERLKIGIEMEYKNVTTKDTRGDPLNSFVIGPTVAWKPTAQTRLDISPLFGCTARFAGG